MSATRLQWPSVYISRLLMATIRDVSVWSTLSKRLSYSILFSICVEALSAINFRKFMSFSPKPFFFAPPLERVPTQQPACIPA